MSKEAVIETIERLSEEEQQKVAAYVGQLLKKREQFERDKKRLEELGFKSGFGGAKGFFGKMSDDFDEPLEDFKEYM